MASKSADKSPGIVFLQIAVQKTASEVGGFAKGCTRKRKLAVAVLYCSAQDDYRVYTASQVEKLLDIMKSAKFVVGYNCLGFDYEVLRGHSSFPCPPTLDLLQNIEKTLGFRVPMYNVASSTFGVHLQSNGNNQTALWKDGRLDVIIVQCKQDVDWLCRIYKHGMEHKSIYVTDQNGRLLTVPIEWETVQP